MGGKRLTEFVECRFSRLYWLHEDIGHTAFAKPLWVGNGLAFSIFESVCFAAVLALQLVSV